MYIRIVRDATGYCMRQMTLYFKYTRKYTFNYILCVIVYLKEKKNIYFLMTAIFTLLLNHIQNSIGTSLFLFWERFTLLSHDGFFQIIFFRYIWNPFGWWPHFTYYTTFVFNPVHIWYVCARDFLHYMTALIQICSMCGFLYIYTYENIFSYTFIEGDL